MPGRVPLCHRLPPTTDLGGDQWVEWNELAVGLNASLLTPERTTMQRIEAIWVLATGLGTWRGVVDWFSSLFSVEDGGRERQHPAFREADSSAVEDSSRVVCCLARETSWRRRDFHSVSQREGEAVKQGKNAQKGEVGGLRKFCHLQSFNAPPFSRSARSSFPDRSTARSSCSFCNHVVVPVAIVSLPPPPPPSPRLCKQTAPHSDLAPASLGRAPPDHRRRPSRRAFQRLLPLGHDQQCQDSRLVQLG